MEVHTLVKDSPMHLVELSEEEPEPARDHWPRALMEVDYRHGVDGKHPGLSYLNKEVLTLDHILLSTITSCFNAAKLV